MAKYSRAYTIAFSSRLQNGNSLEVLRRAWKKLPYAVDGSAEPTALDYPEVGDVEGVKNIFSFVRGSAFNMELVAENSFSLKEALYSEDPRLFRVNETINDNAQWNGWLETDLSEDPYHAKPYIMRAGAVDGLQALQDAKFLDSAGKGFLDPISLTTIITTCLSKTDLNLPVWICCNTYGEGTDVSKPALDQLFVHPFLFVDDADEPFDCLTVLKYVCESFGLIVYQSYGRWMVTHPYSIPDSKLWMYKPTGELEGSILTSTVRQIEDGNVDVADRIRVQSQDARSSLFPSIKKITVETEYGNLRNFLYNARFSILDPLIAGGQIARGWRAYRADYSYVTPDPPTPFQDKYLEITGKAPAFVDKIEDPGIYRTWGKDYDTLTPPASLPVPVGPDTYLHISPPVIAKYHDKIKFTGEYYTEGVKGVKLQLIALPVVNNSIIDRLRIDPTYFVRYADTSQANMLSFSGGTWSRTDRSTIVFDNTKEEPDIISFNGEPPRVVTVAKKEWASFSIETDRLPSKIDAGADNILKPLYYLVQVVLFRGREYTDNKPAFPGNPLIRYRKLTIGVKNGFESTDIEKERVVLDRERQYGREWKKVNLWLGTVGGDNYYSQLFDEKAKLISRFRRSGVEESLALAHLTAWTWLSQYRKPASVYNLSLTGPMLDYGDTFRLENDSADYHVITAAIRRRLEAADFTLVELLKGDVAHTFTRYNVDANGKATAVEAGNMAGTVPDEDDNGLKITFLEPNGPSPDKKSVNGPLVQNGPFIAETTYFNLAWFDPDEDGPWTVTISLKNLIFDYQETVTVNDLMRTTISIPVQLNPTVTVTNASGKKASRITKGGGNKLRAITISSGCSGTTPMLLSNLVNTKKPIKILHLLNTKGESYKFDVVNLTTGSVVLTNDGSGCVIDYASDSFSGPIPSDWDTAIYGVRITGIYYGDWCGQFGQIARCKPVVPNVFGPIFGDRFKKG